MRGLSIVLIFIVLSGCASVASVGAISRANSNYSKGDYNDTISIADHALRAYDYTDEEKAELLFLKASSYVELDDIDAGYATMRYIADKYPDTEHGYRVLQILNRLNSG